MRFHSSARKRLAIRLDAICFSCTYITSGWRRARDVRENLSRRMMQQTNAYEKTCMHFTVCSRMAVVAMRKRKGIETKERRKSLDGHGGRKAMVKTFGDSRARGSEQSGALLRREMCPKDNTHARYLFCISARKESLGFWSPRKNLRTRHSGGV